MTFQDITLKCVDCSNDFQFTAGEQEFYQEKSLTNTPKRCPECRSVRKRSSGKRAPREMFDVICSHCGVETQVPFKPSEEKPVYCKECFSSSR